VTTVGSDLRQRLEQRRLLHRVELPVGRRERDVTAFGDVARRQRLLQTADDRPTVLVAERVEDRLEFGLLVGERIPDHPAGVDGVTA
jgi:hypothetical protein